MNHQRVGRVKGAKALKPLITKWAEMIQTFSDEIPGDAAFWYTERANVGVFAGAVWKSGGVALEEWNAEKGGGKRQRKGRVDLYFSTPKAEYQVEAKLQWVRFGPRTTTETVCDKLQRALRAAEKDRRDVDASESDHRLAMVFAVPIVPEGGCASTAVAQLLDATKRVEGVHFEQWAGVEGALLDREDGRGTDTFPGVLLFGSID